MWRDIKVLVLDEDEGRRHDLKVVLDFLGDPAVTMSYSTWKESLEVQGEQADSFVAIIMADSNIPLAARLKEVHQWDCDIPVITLGQKPSDGDLARIADEPQLKHKLVGTISLPASYNQLLDILHRAQRYREAHRESKLSQAQRPTHLFRSLVGTSREIQNVRTMMSQVADKDVTVLITGESGTGKEVVARNLHYHSARRDKPFVPVNCGAIPADLLESELFGHEKGAFTGAINSRAGRFELAEGGTLFLDEIGDMPLNMQVKILRVLQERTFERVGGTKSIATDVRIIAATHRNLESMIEEESFREDLYYRLNVFPIEMPSLRDRDEDIPLLLHELVSRLESEERGSIRFNSAAILSLCRHGWSGNVRELANLVERMAIMFPYGVVGVQDLPPKYRHVEVEEDDFSIPGESSDRQTNVVSMFDTTLLPDAGINLKEYLANLEKSLIEQALDDSGGVVARAADKLTIRRTTLVEKLRKYGLQRG